MKKRIKIRKIKSKIEIKEPARAEQPRADNNFPLASSISSDDEQEFRTSPSVEQPLSISPQRGARLENAVPAQEISAQTQNERREEETRTYQTAGGLTSAQIERTYYSTQQRSQTQPASRINLQPATQARQNLLNENNLFSNSERDLSRDYYELKTKEHEASRTRRRAPWEA